MKAILAAMGAATFLAGCADPLSDLGRYDAVAMPGEAQAPGLITPPDEVDGLGFLRGLIAESGTGGPSRADLEEEANTRAAAPASPGGFLSNLFTNVAAAPPASDSPSIEPGTVLPWGQLATVCGVPQSQMGTRVGAASGYELWDPSGGATSAHTFYITGFQDGCARQVTAAMALFGDVGTHEMVRYATPQEVMPMTPTDRSYEAIKAATCRVASGTPCGGRIDALDRRTTFLTLYSTFESGDYVDLLLSDGSVAATDFAAGTNT
ncbi:hypothetical protein ACXN5S_15865 [Pseudoroseicyclus sp. H15]